MASFTKHKAKALSAVLIVKNFWGGGGGGGGKLEGLGGEASPLYPPVDETLLGTGNGLIIVTV